MKLLILGGTKFLGRHIVDAALAKGHEVTLFNRGNTNPDLYPDLESLRGDRDSGLAPLKGRRWDVVIDPSGYAPRIVRDSAELLADVVEHYTFISSISVYSDFSEPGIDENSPVATLEDETVEEVTGDTYGALKALCEQAAEAIMPGRVLNVRAGLIVGPHDPTNRFTYWPVRVSKGGDVLAPDSPDYPIQFIDGRDLAAWVLRMAEGRKGGIYNVTGPDTTMTMGKLLETCKAVSGSDASFVWMDEDFLLEKEVSPWSELPLWLPQGWGGMHATDVGKAVADGLTYRPVDETVRATLDWQATHMGELPKTDGMSLPPAGLDAEKEARILASWRARPD